MRWFKNCKTMTKLMLGFGLTGVIMAGVGYMGVTNMAQINANVGNLYEVQLIPISYLTGIRGLTHQVRAQVILAVLAKDEATTRQAVARIEEMVQKIKELEEQFQPTILAETVREAFAAYRQAVQAYRQVRTERVLQPALEGKKEAAYRVMTTEGAPVYQAVIDSINNVIAVKEGIAKAKFEESQVLYTSSRNVMLSLIIAAVLIGLSLGYIIARMVAAALKQVMAVTEQAAAGDLTVRVQLASKDELGQMGVALNGFLDTLHDSLKQVAQSSTAVASASQQLSAASEQLSSGAQEQASSLEETASSLEEITGTVKQSADNARQASQLATGSRDAAEKGGQVVTTAVAAMSEINKSSKKIADIITVIDEIAFQTNLLALNAAVEAARAGEQGRGFAVVAAEVRNLAQRSATAAKEIKGLIQDSVQKVQDGSELVNRSGQTLEEIVGSVKRVTDIVTEIAAASQEQASGIEQVNKAMTQMDQVTQTNAAQTEELSSTAQAMAAQAEQLQALVARFKLAQDAAARQETVALAPTPRTPVQVKKKDLVAKPGLHPTAPVPVGVLAANKTAHEVEGEFEEF